MEIVLATTAGGLAVWWIQSLVEQRRRDNERLQSERVKLYLMLLEPFAAILGSKARNPKDPVRIIQSRDYRDAMFQVNLVGSDDVVRAFNQLMQGFYARGEEAPSDKDTTLKIFAQVGETMLAIRRDLGNRRTKLKALEFFESSITDLRHPD